MVWPESGVLEPHLEFFTALVTVSFALPPRCYPVDCVCSLCTVECCILGLPLDVHGIGHLSCPAWKPFTRSGSLPKWPRASLVQHFEAMRWFPRSNEQGLILPQIIWFLKVENKPDGF